jgi:hypothetical protein
VLPAPRKETAREISAALSGFTVLCPALAGCGGAKSDAGDIGSASIGTVNLAVTPQVGYAALHWTNDAAEKAAERWVNGHEATSKAWIPAGS